MIDKRDLEFILTDQQEEMEERAQDMLCHRKEEQMIDLASTQAQVVIGVRRSGKSTLCYQALSHQRVKYAYADFDDERLVELKAAQLNDVHLYMRIRRTFWQTRSSSCPERSVYGMLQEN